MEKFVDFMKENKVIMSVCWVGLVEIGNIFIQELTGNQVTYMQMLLIGLAALVIYVAIVLVVANLESSDKLKWISSISDQFVHMQIFLDNNTLIIEILEGEVEVLEKLAMIRGFKIEKISEYNGLSKVLVK